MILERHIWRPKIDRRDEVAALGRAECQRRGVHYRILTPLTGLWGLVIFEFQFASWAERAETWRTWSAEPEFQAMWKQSNELVENERRLELYRIHGTPPPTEDVTGRMHGVLHHITYLADQTRRGQFLALVEAECERVGRPFHALDPVAGPANVLTFEFHFEDMAQGEQWWRQWGAQPEAQEYLRRVYQMAQPAHILDLYGFL